MRRIETALELNPNSLFESEALDHIEGWDSLAVVNLMAFADEHFGVQLSPTQINKAKTVADLLSLLGGRVSA
jgi:acyl carrier protein